MDLIKEIVLNEIFATKLLLLTDKISESSAISFPTFIMVNPERKISDFINKYNKEFNKRNYKLIKKQYIWTRRSTKCHNTLYIKKM